MYSTYPGQPMPSFNTYRPFPQPQPAMPFLPSLPPVPSYLPAMPAPSQQFVSQQPDPSFNPAPPAPEATLPAEQPPASNSSSPFTARNVGLGALAVGLGAAGLWFMLRNPKAAKDAAENAVEAGKDAASSATTSGTDAAVDKAAEKGTGYIQSMRAKLPTVSGFAKGSAITAVAVPAAGVVGKVVASKLGYSHPAVDLLFDTAKNHGVEAYKSYIQPLAARYMTKAEPYLNSAIENGAEVCNQISTKAPEFVSSAKTFCQNSRIAGLVTGLGCKMGANRLFNTVCTPMKSAQAVVQGACLAANQVPTGIAFIRQYLPSLGIFGK